MRRDAFNIQLAAAAALLTAAGFLLPDWALFLLTLALAKGLVVLGLLILWRTGLVPFGQALYFGAAAYAVGLLALLTRSTDIVLLTAAAIVIPMLLAGLVGFLLRRYRDIFFAMLSMAFSMILYGVLVKTEALGSTDGFNIKSPTFLGYAPTGGSLRIALFLWVASLALLAAYGAHKYLASAMGRLSSAVRDNEIRVEYLGVSVQRVIHIKLIIAAGLAGAGGGVTAFAVGHIDPNAMTYWTVSGEFVFVTVLSGAGSIWAPFVGSLIFQVIGSFANQYAPHFWQMIVGGPLLLIILFLPNGLWSVFTRIAKRG